MKILFLTQWCQPEPFLKGIPFAKALQARGHEVEILTGFPNYPGGKLYSGYRIHLFQREMISTIPVTRVALYPSHDQSGFRRTMNYLSFSLSSAILGPFLVRKPDVIYVYNLVTLDWAAWILRKWHRSPIVYDIQDLWPDSAADSGMMDHSILLRFLNIWCRGVYRRASHLATLSPGIKAELVNRGVPEKNISVIYNWYDETNMGDAECAESIAADLGGEADFVVMFAGTMGVMQGLHSVLDAAECLMTMAPRIKFVFVGGGVDRDRLAHSAADRRLGNVSFLQRQPPERINAILQKADVLLVHLKDAPLFRITIPSKIQAYLAAGKPILLGVRGDSAEIIRKSGAGIEVTPENPKSIVQGILQFYRMTGEERKHMGRKARKYYEQNLSMDAGVRKFEQIFFKLAKIDITTKRPKIYKN